MKRKRSSSPETGSTCHGSSRNKFEVFLSFRGPDTRTSFTDFLYHTLLDKGISVFMDKQGIDIGEEIGLEIFQAIDDSKICIPIFSKDYAFSSWCLRELERMMQRWKNNELEILPIFYDVEPSDVKLETKVYKDALTLHKKKCGVEIVQRWEEVLKEVTKIKGWDTKNIGQGELAHMITRKVLVKLKVSCVHIFNHLVGMDESVNEVINLLNVESKDIRLIGIWGMGGIGKTTLAKVVYDKLSTNFDSCSFILDIREASQGFGIGLSSIDDGKNMIKIRFCRKKVLIFLDDVDHTRQLMALAAKKEWFGLGSRIVVTTRDKSVFDQFLDQFEHCLIYKVEELNNLTALQLFSKHAFRSNSPPNAFLSLSEKVIAQTGGLPLAIEVIGSFLCAKKEAVWQDTLKKMKYSLHGDVKKKLMLSYKALDHQQQQIFLDIACFLSGYNKSYPYYMWDDCGYFPNEGIEVLLLMSLVKIGEDNLLWMHDQLKDLGRSIVYEENCKDPTKGFRVWSNSCQVWSNSPRVWSNQQSGPDIGQQKKGTGTVAVQYLVHPQVPILTSEDLIKVPNIRLLQIMGWALSGDFGSLFSELRWLTWDDCPEEMQATNFCPKNLVILKLQSYKIDKRWGGWTQLKQCRKLTTLPNSIGLLKYLVELDVSYTRIVELPNTIVNLKSLKVLKMNQSHMQKLPEAIGMLERLEEIHGKNCECLKMIPDDIVRLHSLKFLDLTETHLWNVPKLPQNLVRLYLSSRAAEKALEISSLVSERNLELSFDSSNYHSNFPCESYAGITSPSFNTSPKTAPDISIPFYRSKLSSMTSISSSYLGCLCCLEELQLTHCQNLHRIGKLPSGLRKLVLSNCDLLEDVDLSNLSNFKNLKHLEVCFCPKLIEIQGLDKLESLETLWIRFCHSLRSLPNISNLKKLRRSKLDFLSTYRV
ncbi:hypothetical protein BT93_C0985 [Corymbia citriodora subsp. variegata]|nr:hypothetical protein BT93_C0985 [Corymbia citriodora subsp. variegata]